ncbi:CHAP domain-containing protein, partial [Amycolatopsis plumensis]
MKQKRYAYLKTVFGILMAAAFLVAGSVAAPSAQAASLRENIAAIANAEVGASEANARCLKYGPCTEYEWCAIFTQWVWRTAGVKYIPSSWVATQWAQWGEPRGLYKRRPPGTKGGNPRPGDVAIYGEPDFFDGHISVVVDVLADGNIVTVDGNWNEAVVRRTVDPLASRGGGGNVLISGYVSPPEADSPSY